jgi:hypothetical protein
VEDTDDTTGGPIRPVLARRRGRAVGVFVLLAAGVLSLLTLLATPAFAADGRSDRQPSPAYVAPVEPVVVLARFAPPLRPWLPGNRGVDLGAHAGQEVLAAADGRVIFARGLAGRGVISIDHGAVRTTYEPLDPEVVAGQKVRRGQLIGHVSNETDACGPPGTCLHWGAIKHDTYIDPMRLLASSRPTALRLLPIWNYDVPPDAVVSRRSAMATPAPAAGSRLANASPRPKAGNSVGTPGAVPAATITVATLAGVGIVMGRLRRTGR